MSFLSRFAQILKAAIAAEENIVPIFVHNPNSQGIAAVIMAAESEVGTVLETFQQANTTPAPKPVPEPSPGTPIPAPTPEPVKSPFTS